MTLTPSTAPQPPFASCPGPIPTSEAHAEHCRACGKCDAIIAALVQNGGLSGQDFEQDARRPEAASR